MTPIGTCTFSSLFIAPFAIDRNNPNHLVFGGASYCETLNGGATWVRSNNGLPFSRNGGIQAVAIAPSNAAVLYSGTDAGYVYKATTGNTAANANWADCASAALPKTAPTTAIAVDLTSADTIYASFGGFGVGHVWKTTDCVSWTNITSNLPDAPTTSVTVYPISGGHALIVGTDVGVFLSTNEGASWSALQNGLPKVGIQQVFTDVLLTTLFVATHGRGMWTMPIPQDTFVAPAVSSVSPQPLSIGGGTITITGMNFRSGAAVYIDGTAASGVTFVNGTTLTATAPAHAAGLALVVVVNTDGQGSVPVRLTYAVPTPVNRAGSGGIAPAVGPLPRATGGGTAPLGPPPSRT